MEKRNLNIDDALKANVVPSDIVDETGDGVVDELDLKHQLNRIEAQLEQQNEQNRVLLRNQRYLLRGAIIVVVVLCVVMGALLLRFNRAYDKVMTTCSKVDQIAEPLQESLNKLDSDELNSLMDVLPEIADKLNQIDVNALNDIMARLPATMDAVTQLQQQINNIASTLSNFSLGSLFG